jgi:hypothetical protein
MTTIELYAIGACVAFLAVIACLWRARDISDRKRQHRRIADRQLNNLKRL